MNWKPLFYTALFLGVFFIGPFKDSNPIHREGDPRPSTWDEFKKLGGGTQYDCVKGIPHNEIFLDFIDMIGKSITKGADYSDGFTGGKSWGVCKDKTTSYLFDEDKNLVLVIRDIDPRRYNLFLSNISNKFNKEGISGGSYETGGPLGGKEVRHKYTFRSFELEGRMIYLFKASEVSQDGKVLKHTGAVFCPRSSIEKLKTDMKMEHLDALQRNRKD